MKEIPLTQGKIMQCDDEDFEWFDQFNWRAHSDGKNWYARSTFKLSNGKRLSRTAHKFLMIGAGRVDHIDGNGLNNQKTNLRPATTSQNSMNMKKGRGKNSSSFKGVSWNSKHEFWYAAIAVDGKDIYLGIYESEEDAAHVYDYAARIYFGEFARLNFP